MVEYCLDRPNRSSSSTLRNAALRASFSSSDRVSKMIRNLQVVGCTASFLRSSSSPIGFLRTRMSVAYSRTLIPFAFSFLRLLGPSTVSCMLHLHQECAVDVLPKI